MATEEPVIHQLIYVSAATAPFSGPDLATLLLKARENNRRLGVSGLLVHKSGSFFQVLEGPEGVVESLFERISADARHERTVVLLRGPVLRASFAEWTMGFVEGERSEVDRIPGFNDFFRKGFASAHASEGASSARDLALAFRDGRFRQFVDTH